jgi:hypothetical protein
VGQFSYFIHEGRSVKFFLFIESVSVFTSVHISF